MTLAYYGQESVILTFQTLDLNLDGLLMIETHRRIMRGVVAQQVTPARLVQIMEDLREATQKNVSEPDYIK
jgi:hypothetical protein